MSQQPTVLFLPKWYPHRLSPLDGNFVENHAKAVAQYCSIAILFVHSEERKGMQPYEIEEESPFGYPEIRVFFRKPNASFGLLNKVISFYRYCKAQWKGYQHYLKNHPAPALTHIHVLGRTAPLAIYLRQFKKIPFIITEHWSGYHAANGAYKGLLKKWVTKYTVKRAEKVTTVSKDLQQQMERHQLFADYRQISNVVQTEIFKPIQKAANKRKQIIHVSNMSHKPKNLPAIIEVLDQLAKERDDFEFILVGDGEESPSIIKQLETSALADRFEFCGEQPMEFVAKRLATADVMVLFSFFENQPCVMLESFASGTAVIVPDVGGVAEQMDSSRGKLVPALDQAALKAAFTDVLDNPQQFDSETIRQFAEDNFSEAVIGKQFCALYQEVIADVS